MRLPNIIEFYSATEFQLWLVPLWIIINLFAVGSDTLLFLTHKESGFPFAFTSNFALDQSPLYAVLVNPPAWSLPIELGFYVLAPFLFRRKRTRFLVLILSLTLRAVLITKFENSDPWSYRFFPTEIAIFIMGLYLYEFYESIFSKSRGKKISIYLVGPLAAILLANYLVHEKYLKTIPSVVNQVQIISVSILVIPALFYLSRRVKIDKFLGDLSYSVYLLHFGAISLLTYFGFKPNLSMTLLISTTLSALLLPLNQKLEIKLRGSVDRNWGR
jgi:peptidoglycan/LPS O-acetylase OafA/YrhL